MQTLKTIINLTSQSNGFTKTVLNNGLYQNMQFELPLEIKLKKGDEIIFHDIELPPNPEDAIEIHHSRYQQIEIYRSFLFWKRKLASYEGRTLIQRDKEQKERNRIQEYLELYNES